MSKRRSTSSILLLAALLLLPAASAAQQGQTSTGAEEASDEEGSQEPPERPGVKQFDDVTVKRIRPDELPPEMKTEIPSVLRKTEGRLPTPPNAKQLETTASHVRERTYEVVSIQKPDAPGKATPIIRRGHAVLVSGSKEGAPPILITSLFWLADSDRLFVVPHELSHGTGENTAEGEDGTPSPRRRSLAEVSVDGRANGWLEENRSKLVAAGIFRPDEHRNLATIVPRRIARSSEDGEGLKLPSKGLTLFDLGTKSPTRLYGYSPQAGGGLAQARLLRTKPKQAALVYYLQTTYGVVFGAPIVSTDGELLVLTAFKHPKEGDIVLTVPPSPISDYVDSVLSTLE